MPKAQYPINPAQARQCAVWGSGNQISDNCSYLEKFPYFCIPKFQAMKKNTLYIIIASALVLASLVAVLFKTGVFGNSDDHLSYDAFAIKNLDKPAAELKGYCSYNLHQGTNPYVHQKD